MNKAPVFVIGDAHGHLNRVTALLEKTGFLDSEGLPTEQTNSASVVQLGDLGHYGVDTQDRDLACWRFAAKHPWFHVIMGNHDWAVFDTARHRFIGYTPPHTETIDLIHQKAPMFSASAHGYLLTHAGLHPSYDVRPLRRSSEGGIEPASHMSFLINRTCEGATFTVPVRDDIARYRGGHAEQGSILWRDYREDLSDIPQVFGHTRDPFVRKQGESWCIDIADRDDDMLAGIWLPSMQVVAVGPNAWYVEAEHNE